MHWYIKIEKLHGIIKMKIRILDYNCGGKEEIRSRKKYGILQY